MFWFFFRWLFWRPSYTYKIVVGRSNASAAEAAKSAELQVNNATTSGWEPIGIAADALCCAGEEGGAGAEWDVQVCLRK
jgi:hypothetical protein